MGFNIYRNTTANISPVTAVSTTGAITTYVRGFNITNPNTIDVHIKFFDVNYTSVTVGTTAPAITLKVPAGASIYEPWVDNKIIAHFNSYLTYAVTVGLADNNTTAPTSNIQVELYHEEI